MRHAAPVDGGAREQLAKTSSQAALTPSSSEEQLYTSSRMLQQHKKSHLAHLRDAERKDPLPVTESPAMSARSSLTSQGDRRGFSSHREMQYCKRFNAVHVKS